MLASQELKVLFILIIPFLAKSGSIDGGLNTSAEWGIYINHIFWIVFSPLLANLLLNFSIILTKCELSCWHLILLKFCDPLKDYNAVKVLIDL